MAYKEKTTEENFGFYRQPVKNRLSEAELIELEKEIESFSTIKKVKSLKKDAPDDEIKWFDERSWLKSKGAMNENGGVIVKKFKSAIYDSQGHCKEKADCEPILFEQLMEDLNQYRFWKGRQEFIEKKKIEGLENLAKGISEGMKIPPPKSEWETKKDFLDLPDNW